jgi:hypothetical protein
MEATHCWLSFVHRYPSVPSSGNRIAAAAQIRKVPLCVFDLDEQQLGSYIVNGKLNIHMHLFALPVT